MSKKVIILEGESVEEFDSLCVRMQAEFQPATEREHFLVDQIIQHEWLMRRGLRMQQHLLEGLESEADADPKRMRLVVRYYETHERAATRAKRELESMRRQHLKAQKAQSQNADRQSAAARRVQRQWEQLLKKMPTLSNWVN